MSIKLEINGKLITIDDDTVKKIEALSPFKGTFWTPEKDAIIMKYWNVKEHKALAEDILGTSETSARRRYRKLTRGGK